MQAASTIFRAPRPESALDVEASPSNQREATPLRGNLPSLKEIVVCPAAPPSPTLAITPPAWPRPIRWLDSSFVGSGVQCRVDRFNDLQVIKTPYSVSQVALNLLYRKPQRLLDLSACIDAAENRREQLLQNVEWFERHSEFGHLVGNPELRAGRILQDRVTPLGFSKTPVVQLLPRLVEHYFNCWRSGFSDFSFGVVNNFGEYPDGRIITLDLGDIGREYSEIAKVISSRKWEHARWARRGRLGAEATRYCISLFNANLTVENLNSYWREVQ